VDGPPTVHLLDSLKPEGTVLYVHIGSLPTQAISPPGALFRSKDLVIRGSRSRVWSVRDLRVRSPRLLKAMAMNEKQAVRIEELQDMEEVWHEETSDRIIFVP